VAARSTRSARSARAAAASSTVTDFKHSEHISRRQAAERLTDVAYALVVRSPVALQIDGQRVVVPAHEELLVQWELGYADGRLQLKMEVGWPGTELPAPAR
jgi:hypothetical protein